MDPSKTRQAQAHARQRHMALAPSSAPGQLRMPTSRTRGKHKSTAALVPQGVQPSSQRPYQQSFNGVPQKRKIPAHHHYDRQPQFVGTPEDVEDDDLLYPDEEGSFGQYSYDEEPMPQTIGAIMEILSDVQSQLTSLSHGFEEQKKRQVKADAVLKHLSRQSGENLQTLEELVTTTHQVDSRMDQLPLKLSSSIVHLAQEQPNLLTQGSTNQTAFHMGLDSVDPSNLTNNNRAGQGNNGVQG
ncbi:hypothetical protein FPOAC2_13448 [Fusarium poae]|uniref:Uncharacterized protein n=1 Tax=Fusarium poae TaxID=36050 RepID=A0A1B8A616_FUSPO|nr:hypothetical protein FPOA_13781 [Fusarium poae]OBS15834.1 hypothetical protein FPOA_13395 [Fusarium poae]OBS15917.1 hypothetical protein FPOA_13329 [Fusarium poae]OBS17035.1 hypothetical protein FPOA_12428 [Fusarium poae]